MSDPHEQANVQQIEWLLGALAEPLPPGPPAAPSTLHVLPEPQVDSDELH
ncbi:hypothetical protein [Deinococcus radiotolerans]|uniref:Uncharacterized protein n=1 Tax=Deinococcus radiotolerans TaxID=1309407 RepID=A0ABQ2FJG3_9DEIO|nr:hypothetical protein [Deinococcus radiotolerans]GGK99216.1 hypothetical protein GCM10010844_16790 [Deinococcus radiotolerans]